jgi:hypothetical protein
MAEEVGEKAPRLLRRGSLDPIDLHAAIACSLSARTR